jgi:hypothetical protein
MGWFALLLVCSVNNLVSLTDCFPDFLVLLLLAQSVVEPKSDRCRLRQGLKDRLAATDEDSEELQQEIEELKLRIDDLSTFDSGASFHTKSGEVNRR